MANDPAIQSTEAELFPVAAPQRAFRGAVHPDPCKRYDSLSEYTFDLRHPNAKYLNASAAPLIERNPLLFWKCATFILGCIVVALLASRHFGR